MKDIIITPELLRSWEPCADGYKWGLPIVGEGITLKKLLPEFRRADWMLWTLRKADVLKHVQLVELAVVCAKTVLDIYEKQYPLDKRPRQAIEAAISYAKNPTEESRKAAHAAAPYAAHAHAAAYAAYAADPYADAAAAVYAAANAADAAHSAAYAAAYAAKVFGKFKPNSGI